MSYCRCGAVVAARCSICGGEVCNRHFVVAASTGGLSQFLATHPQGQSLIGYSDRSNEWVRAWIAAPACCLWCRSQEADRGESAAEAAKEVAARREQQRADQASEEGVRILRALGEPSSRLSALRGLALGGRALMDSVALTHLATALSAVGATPTYRFLAGLPGPTRIRRKVDADRHPHKPAWTIGMHEYRYDGYSDGHIYEWGEVVLVLGGGVYKVHRPPSSVAVNVESALAANAWVALTDRPPMLMRFEGRVVASNLVPAHEHTERPVAVEFDLLSRLA